MSLKICMICPTSIMKKGGVEKVVRELARNFSTRNEVLVLTPNGNEPSKTFYLDRVEIKQIQSKNSQFPLPVIKYLSEIKTDFDIIHVHNSSTSIPFLSSLVLKQHSGFVISPHFHPIASNGKMQIIKNSYDLFINKSALNNCRRVYCVSNFEKGALCERIKFDHNKIEVVPNGVDVSLFRDAQPFDTDYNIILYIGRLERYKHVDIILKSMKLVDKARLVVIGDGPFRNDLELIVDKLRLNDKITFLQNCSDLDLARWIATSKCLINISSIEAFGLTVLEAIAAGKIAILNNSQGLAEIGKKFDRNCILINSINLSPSSLSSLISQAITKNSFFDPNILEYDWSRISQRFLNSYELLLNG